MSSRWNHDGVFSPVMNRDRGPGNRGRLQNETRERQMQQAYGNGGGTHSNHRAGRDTSRRNSEGDRHNHGETHDSRIVIRERNMQELRQALQTCVGHT